MSQNLMQANRQWASRPDDERFASLVDLQAFTRGSRERSIGSVVANRDLRAMPAEGDESHRGLVVVSRDERIVTPTHWSFGQLAAVSGAPAGYLRRLPSELAADCVNYGLVTRDVEECGVLVRNADDGYSELAAVTGPGYGRIWNSRIVDALVDRFGDGVSGSWRVPGEFGKAVTVTKANTTLYASDRDLWVFLADERNRVTVPNRRAGESGTLARGFFVWNSEVGAATFGLAQFLFDYVCCNRIVWGAEQYSELRIRHTSGAPHRFLEEIQPQLAAYSESSTAGIDAAILGAQRAKLEADKVSAFLSTRFGGKRAAAAIAQAHIDDEGRPIETVWDAVTGATAYARAIPYQDERVAIERVAGELLAEASD